VNVISEHRSTASTLLLPLVRGWSSLAILIVVSWIVVAVVVIRGGRKFRAESSLSTVSTARALPSAATGFAASLLGFGGGQGSGIQLTPGVVVRISRMDGVLYGVAVDSIGGRRVVDLLARTAPDKPVPPQQVVRVVRRHLTAQYDVQTGLITVAVVHRDSALARAVLARVIDAVSVTYREAARAQAGEIREAQQRRLDSAEARLRGAEEALRHFVEGNRVVAEYTPEYVRSQELDRAVQTASAVYTQALADRDAAWAKELEETPVVVAIDPPPPELPREPRGLGLKLILTTITIFVFGWLFLIGRAGLRRLLLEPTSTETDLAAAILAVPGARGVLGLLLAADLRSRGHP
jgi:hypothetical protein